MGQPANSPKNASAEKSGSGWGTFPPLSPVLDGVTDYLLHPGGLLPVHDTGTELVALSAWLRRQEEAAARRCACGKPCGSPTARTCGGAECIAALALAPIPSLAASPDIRGGPRSLAGDAERADERLRPGRLVRGVHGAGQRGGSPLRRGRPRLGGEPAVMDFAEYAASLDYWQVALARGGDRTAPEPEAPALGTIAPTHFGALPTPWSRGWPPRRALRSTGRRATTRPSRARRRSNSGVSARTKGVTSARP
jgi:hypothetical protein